MFKNSPFMTKTLKEAIIGQNYKISITDKGPTITEQFIKTMEFL